MMQLAQERAVNKLREDMPMSNIDQVVMFRPTKTPYKPHVDCMGPTDVVVLYPPVYHVVRMRVNVKSYRGHISDMRAYRIPIGVPERGKAQHCLAGTMCTDWLL
ncbi:hypothetical protein SARC_10674 [Sphaeroforma arctica JP610]|uniref:Uncharacterized protein n=1 Tax=Sphaeroforma arctica JP610 TaxID=667725 RepID=A0A0L0FJ84_9EUKA|nr:hypothetical protein SARC_10674 [Sphaeroforma arctica JP610]KNC76849.1 hypothetical protein SARC_10674 [Sphaeroforma arctica JP610]|eukprot:XP_014150751.1 hypothetical protein SARC_10674 [Sphaeroforma arctica JP610]